VKHSKRAQILSEVLGYINHGDWAHHGDFLVFGRDAFEAHVNEMGGGPRSELSDLDETLGSLRDLAGRLKVKKGQREIARRVSLKAPPPDSSISELTNWLSNLTRKERGLLTDALKGTGHSQNPRQDSDLADAVDAALASASLHYLDESIARLSTLDPIAPVKGAFGGPRGTQYFEEAHGCDLAGLRIASAVLCRAMLEAALIETIDPQGRIRQNLKMIMSQGRHEKESYIGKMIEEAAKLHIDAECAKAAIEIRDAGNDAIHNLPRFKKKYELRMRCIVDNLRKILIDLYD
jgi:hypothetical protein